MSGVGTHASQGNGTPARAVRLLAWLSVLVVIGAVVGVVMFLIPHVHGISAGAPCAALTSPAAQSTNADTTARAAIIIDVSGSTRGEAGDLGGPYYAADLSGAVDSAVDHQYTVSIGSFSGSASLAFPAAAVVSDWKADNADQQDAQIQKSTEEGCLQKAVAEAADSPARSPGTDPLAAIAGAAQVLRQTKGPKQLLVATDGLVTTGCANLTGSGFSGSAEIKAITDLCLGADQEINAGELAGVDVTFVGIGQPGPGQPVPTASQQAWLTTLWQSLCSIAGAATCSFEPSLSTVTAGPLPQATTSAQPDATVGFGDGRHELYSVSAAALFPVDEDVMLPSGRQELADIAVQIRTSADARVTVYGYVDPTGPAARNVQLAQNRAEAVASVLRSYGIGTVTAQGRGTPTTCPYTLPSPVTSQERYQCDRRVDIVVDFTKGP